MRRSNLLIIGRLLRENARNDKQENYFVIAFDSFRQAQANFANPNPSINPLYSDPDDFKV